MYLNKADKIYNELVKEIYEEGVWDKGENVRTVYSDGTPAYTKSVFGKQVVFEEGEIPLLTSKFVGWKTALKEMLLFWSHQTVKKEDFEAWNVRIWDEWFKEDGTLGKSYAYQFESRPERKIVKVKPIIKEHHGKILPIKFEGKLTPNWDCKDYYVGKTIHTDNFGEFTVIDVYSKNNEDIAMIQFENSLSTREIKRSRLTAGSKKEIKDNFSRTLFGVGYLGNYEKFKRDKFFKKYFQVWTSMISRCYEPNNENYEKHYSGNGVFVDERWHSFENFLLDMKIIPQYFIAREAEFKDFELDKDYFGSNCYSVDTCVWLPKRENNLYRKTSKPFIAINKEKNICKIFLTTTELKRELDLDTGDASRYLNGKSRTKTVKGFHLEYIEDNVFLYRYSLSSNQVVDLIKNIKESPMSRRLMSSFWNDSEVDEKALQECAMQTTWNVRDGKLDLLLYSRSVDSMLGLPYNWIQYWFLLQMMSQATGLKAGRFIHQMGNVHYYDRHEKVLLQQLESEIYEQPEFWINPDVDDFFQFSPEDIEIKGYKHGGRFFYEVAI